MMKKPFVVYPFLFAVFPVLFLYARNMEEILFFEILLTLAIVLSFALLLLLLSRLILRNSTKAEIIVSVFLILFFSYGHAYNVIHSCGWQIKSRYLLPLFGILFICGAYFIISSCRPLYNFTRFLSVMAFCLVIISLINVTDYGLKTKRTTQLGNRLKENIKVSSVEEDKKDILPDIYYIILDRYPSSDSLQKYFNFDNSEFTDYLTRKGFYIASKSVANYPKTFLSLASSLNMKHLTYLADEVGEETSDRKVVYNMLQDYEVWRFLKHRGYRFIHVGWYPTSRNKYADMNLCFSIKRFLWYVLNNTMLGPFISKPIISMRRERILYEFDKLAEIPNIKEPTFIFAHILLPHEPFIFGSNGEVLTKEQIEAQNDKEKFLNQLIFANKRTKLLIDQILSKSDHQPIIILQSDEGPLEVLEEFRGSYIDWKKLSEGTLKVHMRIFNAYYLPSSINKNILYPSITPVNSFRLIFNAYFGTNYELLENKSYIFEDEKYLYKFIDVTDKVKYN